MICLYLPLLVLWGWVFGSQMWFVWSVTPAALARWAEEHGYQIVQRHAFLPFEHRFIWSAGPFRRVNRLTVRNADWHSRHCWVLVGRRLWPWLTVETCPVEVSWDTPW